MERISIQLPQNFYFTSTIQIRITDLNYGGHVGNDSFLSIIHEARVRYLQYHGYSELDVEGATLIMSDVAIEFKKELHYGDEVIVSVEANGFDKYGFDLFYLLEIVKNEEKMCVAKAKTGMLCFNYQSKKIATLPANAFTKLSNHSS